MTLVACWFARGELTVAADTRLSNSGDTGGAVRITDRATKIFTTPVSIAERKGKSWRHRDYPPIGFAFAGSSLFANSIQAVAAISLQNLFGKIGGIGPSIFEIAELYERVTKLIGDDIGESQGRFPDLQAFVFGYCRRKKENSLWALATHVEANELQITLDELNTQDGIAYAIGSGADEFVRIHGEHRAEGVTLTPFDNFELVVRSGKVPSVSSHRQYATCTKGGARLVPALVPSKSKDDPVTISIIGCDARELGPVGTFSVGHEVLGPSLSSFWSPTGEKWPRS